MFNVWQVGIWLESRAEAVGVPGLDFSMCKGLYAGWWARHCNLMSMGIWGNFIPTSNHAPILCPQLWIRELQLHSVDSIV